MPRSFIVRRNAKMCFNSSETDFKCSKMECACIQRTSPSREDEEREDKGKREEFHLRVPVLAQCDAVHTSAAKSKQIENVGYVQEKTDQIIENNMNSQNATSRESTSELGDSGVQTTPEIDGVPQDEASGLYNCPQCGKVFKTLHTYKVHMSMPAHTSARPFVCRVCGKGFRLSSTLSRHKVIHTNERPHKCRVCYKAFNRSSTLNAHMKTHKNGKPYCCNICGCEFGDKSQFINHVVSHSTGNPGHFVKQDFSSHFDALIRQQRQFYVDSSYNQLHYNAYHRACPVMYYL